jgi:hypothetical protein
MVVVQPGFGVSHFKLTDTWGEFVSEIARRAGRLPYRLTTSGGRTIKCRRSHVMSTVFTHAELDSVDLKLTFHTAPDFDGDIVHWAMALREAQAAVEEAQERLDVAVTRKALDAISAKEGDKASHIFAVEV